MEADDKQLKVFIGSEVVVVGENVPNTTMYTMKMQYDHLEDKNAFLGIREQWPENDPNDAEEIADNDNIGGWIRRNRLRLWHERLAHQTYAHVKEVLRNNNIKFSNTKMLDCDAYIKGKMHQQTPNRDTKTTYIGEIILTDLCGPMEEKSLGGSEYFVLFKDDFLKYIMIILSREGTKQKRVLRILSSVLRRRH